MLDNDEHPKVFISYSWDSEEHKKWVLNLANDLRNQGIDAIVDEFLTEIKTQNLNKIMIENIESSKFVVVILTEKYAEKAEKFNDGVGFESKLLLNYIKNNIEKLILVARPQSSFEKCFPSFLKGVYCLNFSEAYDIDELARRIYKEPKYIKKDLGKKRKYKSIILESNLDKKKLNNLNQMSDEEKFKYYLMEAEQNNAESQYNLGSMYYNGLYVNQNYERASYWYTKAAEQGHAIAQYELGSMYNEGKGVEQNFEKASYWYIKAAEQGNADAQFNLGVIYEFSTDALMDFEKSVYWYTKAAKQGHTDAQNNLGCMYNQGKGVNQDYKKASYWYTKAAGQGSSCAQGNLGHMYTRNAKMNWEKAIYWYTKAAEQGDEDAQFNLGFMYNHGYCIERDYEKAIYWYTKAAEQGNEDAIEALERLK